MNLSWAAGSSSGGISPPTLTWTETPISPDQRVTVTTPKGWPVDDTFSFGFRRWKVSDGNPVAHAKSRLFIERGSGAAFTLGYYHDGNVSCISCPVKEFDHWEVTSGGTSISIADPSACYTTVSVYGCENATVEPVYRDR